MRPTEKEKETTMTAATLTAKIGNVIEIAEIGGVFYTLAADAVVRVNDADEGDNVSCVRCPSMAIAAILYAETVAAAKMVS
jgi:hypothetical protein